MRTQVEEDAFQAWIYASNCLLYENDPGPAELNTGTTDEPRMVPRAQAWQHAYALNVIVQCEADHARLTAAASQCRASIADAAARLGAQRACEWSRAADLCDQAARMVEDAGAIGDDKARRRLLAGSNWQANRLRGPNGYVSDGGPGGLTLSSASPVALGSAGSGSVNGADRSRLRCDRAPATWNRNRAAAKTRHKSPRTVMRYVKPGDEAVAEVTRLLGPPRRSH